MEAESILLLTKVFCSIIIVATVWSFIYINKSKKDGLISQRKKWIDQLPSMISSLGVLGTFTGIALGLSYFDPKNITASIPELLEGLKTAFYTSLCGMTGSMLLTRFANVVLDDIEFMEDQEGKSTRQIVDAIKVLQTSLTKMNNETTNNFKNEVNSSLSLITDALNQIKDDVEELKGQATELREDLDNRNQSVDKRLAQITSVVSTATASISKIDNAISEFENKSETYPDLLEEMVDNLESIKKQRNR